MTSDDHRTVRDMLGAFSLGHLSSAEEAAVRCHLDTCPDCRHELADITPVARALGLVDLHWLSNVAQPAPDLEQRILAAVTSERRDRERARRGRWVLLTAAAVLAVLTVGGLGALIGNRTATPVAGPTVPIEPVAVASRVAGVDASAGVVAHTWGVEIKLEAVGLRPGASYTAVVTTADGRRRSAGGFVGTGEVTMNCNLNSDVLRPDAAAFTVLDENGQAVLSAQL